MNVVWLLPMERHLHSRSDPKWREKKYTNFWCCCCNFVDDLYHSFKSIIPNSEFGQTLTTTWMSIIRRSKNSAVCITLWELTVTSTFSWCDIQFEHSSAVGFDIMIPPHFDDKNDSTVWLPLLLLLLLLARCIFESYIRKGLLSHGGI